MLISVIVPVYNAERYVQICADSILAQSYRNFELILVDDGSTDNSSKICDDIAASDSRVQVIHQKNGGVSAARNSGILSAKGEYVAFVDNDDLMPKNALEVLLEDIENNKPLVIQGEVILRNNYNDLSTEIDYEASSDTDYVNINDFVLRNGVSRTDVWGKLYHRDLAVKHLFPQGHYGEDLYFNGMMLSDSEVREVAVVNKPVYIHFENNDSASHKWTSEDFVDIADTVYKLYIEISKVCSNVNIINVYYKLVFTQFASLKYNVILRKKYHGEIRNRMKAIRRAVLRDLPKAKLSLKDKLICYVISSFNRLYREYIVRRDPTMRIYEKNVKDSLRYK